MNKLILKDGTILDILEAPGVQQYTMHFDTLEDYVAVQKLLTEENLSAYELQTGEGLTFGRYENKLCNSASLTLEWDEAGAITGVAVQLNITDVNMTEKRLKAVEETLGIHDGAIGDLGEIVSGLAEGGQA